MLLYSASKMMFLTDFLSKRPYIHKHKFESDLLLFTFPVDAVFRDSFLSLTIYTLQVLICAVSHINKNLGLRECACSKYSCVNVMNAFNVMNTYFTITSG